MLISCCVKLIMWHESFIYGQNVKIFTSLLLNNSWQEDETKTNQSVKIDMNTPSNDLYIFIRCNNMHLKVFTLCFPIASTQIAFIALFIGYLYRRLTN